MTLPPFLGKGVSVEKKAGALNRVVSILLQGVARHGFQYSKEAFARFETGIRKIRTEFDEALDEDEPLVLAGAAVRLMEEYSDGAVRHLRARQNEFEGVVAVLCEALFEVTDAAPQTMVRIKEIERDLGLATSAEEVVAVKTRLARCLAELRKPTKPAKAPAVHGGTDLLTGLPDAGYARAAFEAIWGKREGMYAAIIVLERLEAINVRFGYKAGDEMLMILSQHVAQNTGPNDQLFRWRGPCLVSLLETSAEFEAMASARIEHAIRMKDRELVVPISTSHAVFPLGAISTVDDLVSQLHDYAGTRTKRALH